nr:ATP-binding protein [uncultured Desulfobacter sp.]
MTIIVFDAMFLAFSCLSLGTIRICLKSGSPFYEIKNQLTAVFLLHAFYSLLLSLQWTNISSLSLEKIEDLISVMIPISWLFLFHIYKHKMDKLQIQNSEERLSLSLQGAKCGIWDWNLKTGEVFFDPNYFRIAGYDPNEFPYSYESWRTRVHPDDIKGTEVKLKAYLAKQLNEYVAEFRFKTKVGEWMWIQGRGKVFKYDKTGEPVRFTGVHIDITDYKKMAEQLKQAQKMEAIGTLAGGIAHDFNNILSGILGYSQLAHENLKNPEKTNEYIEQIIKGSQRAADLTKQILTFSRQGEYKKQPFAIYLEVTDALKLLRSSIPSTIEIKSKLDSKKKVLADPIEIHQVIMNLCTNAYHAMRQTGGCLTVSLTDVEFSGSKFFKGKKVAVGEYIDLEVSDTGSGMDKKTLERVFEPYFTTKEKGDGTGMGLALADAIVEKHDGFYDVKSEPGKGTTFHLYFPIVKGSEEKINQKIEKNSQLSGNEKIMVVDDEESITTIYKALLENFGYQVKTFGNAVDALEIFKTDPDKFDLIITDMTMPGFTGDKFALEIFKIKPDLPVILCSGFSDNMSPAKALKLGIKYFIQKPILNQELMIIIRKIFEDNDNTMPLKKPVR